MRIRLFTVAALLGALLLESCYTRIANISSPDNNIRVSVSDSILTVRYGGKVVQTIKIGDNFWTESSRIVKTVEERYTMLSGKRRECTYVYKAMSCRDAQGKNLLVRVSNDGVAFRFNGADEHVSFVIPDGTKRWLQRQKTDYEGFYPESSQAADGKYSYPALVEYGEGIFGLITESGINHGNSCSYLTCSGDRYTVTYTDNDETDVHAWRILMLGSLADRPEAYLNLPEQVRSLLSGLPSAWDYTRLLAGYPGQCAVIARSSGDTWYIAGINGTNEELTIEPNYSRIGESVVLKTLITDRGSEPGQGFNIQNNVKAGKLVLPARGGFVALAAK